MEAGKHVYVEKPLAYTVHEARALDDIARRTGVVTQMGNQGHSEDGARLINEWVEAGVLGGRHRSARLDEPADLASGLPAPRPLGGGGCGPAGISSGTAARSSPMTADVMDAGYPAPVGMNWNLYLGPTPKEIPLPPRLPSLQLARLGRLRGRRPGRHGRAPGRPPPIGPWGSPTPPPSRPPRLPGAGRPRIPLPTRTPRAPTTGSPARDGMPPVDMHWYDGGLMPPRPRSLPDEVELNREGGVIFVGERGILMHGHLRPRPGALPRVAGRGRRSRPAEPSPHRGHPPDELG